MSNLTAYSKLYSGLQRSYPGTPPGELRRLASEALHPNTMPVMVQSCARCNGALTIELTGDIVCVNCGARKFTSLSA